MKKYCLFLFLMCSIVAKADSSLHPNNYDMIIWIGGGLAYTAYDDIKDGLMKHGYAAPGTVRSDFEAAIKENEKIDAVPAEFFPSPKFSADHSYLFKYEGKKAVYYGRFVQNTNFLSESISTLLTVEITNLASFVAELKMPSNSISAYLLGRFSESNRLAVIGFPESQLNEKTLETILIKQLDVIVSGPSIYEEKRFRGVNLSFGTHMLLKHNLNPPPETGYTHEQMVAMFNRMLLEDAYPSNLPLKRMNNLRRYVAIKY